MKKKIALIQMQAVLADVETNYRHAEELMEIRIFLSFLKRGTRGFIFPAN